MSNLPILLSDQEINQLIMWVREAGQIALNQFGKITAQIKADNSLVTSVDIEIEQLLSTRIKNLFPDHEFIGEERNEWDVRADTTCIWVIDPLDGTTAFTQGLPGWGISLGLLYRGQPYFGLFYMPLIDDLTCTHFSEASKVKQTKKVRRSWGQKGFLAVGSSSVHRKFKMNVPRVRALGSVGASLIYTARGTASAALLPKARIWDIVAGGAILQQSGGNLQYLSGKSVDFLSLLDGQLPPESIIAGHPNMLKELKQTVQPFP